MSDQSLLPPNATGLEKAVSLLGLRVTNLPVPLLSLHRVDDCPVAYLPWLAWARRVEYWNPDWSATQKRQAIAQATTFNRQRGTRSSIEQLLDQVLGSTDYQLLAWHQLTPKGQPYTFSVRIDDLLSIAQLAQIHSAVDATKSVRDQYSITATITQTSLFYPAGAVVTGTRVRMSTAN